MKTVLKMIGIFVLAGAFAASARAMGAIDTMVNLTLSVVPSQVLLVGVFVSAMLVSLGIGTSVGTIVAITPFASDLAVSSGLNVPMMVAAVVGGALFGDNLSIISDTTIAATQTQQIDMREKFIANSKVALPAALLTTLIYIIIGLSAPQVVNHTIFTDPSLLLITPYLFVFLTALVGLNVVVVLLLANILTGLIGVGVGAFSWHGWLMEMCAGAAAMKTLILISLIAGLVMMILRRYHVANRLMKHMNRYITSAKGAQVVIAGLVSAVNLCTANNTIAILTVGPLARDIADRYGVSRRRSASLLDTFSCCVQGLLPYGAQLLMAAGIAGINPLPILPWLFYPIVLALCSFVVIYFIPDR